MSGPMAQDRFWVGTSGFDPMYNGLIALLQTQSE